MGEEGAVKRDEALVPGKNEQDLRPVKTEEEGKKPVTKGHTLYDSIYTKSQESAETEHGRVAARAGDGELPLVTRGSLG